MDKPELTKELARARRIVFLLLKIRNRSEKEIRDRLKLKGFDSIVIEKTLQYFKDAQFIDDRQFAKWWIDVRLLKPFGFNRIKFELKSKGISDDILNEALPEASNQTSEILLVDMLVKKRQPRYKNLDKLTMKRRLFDYLARRGFSSESINQVIQKL